MRIKKYLIINIFLFLATTLYAQVDTKDLDYDNVYEFTEGFPRDHRFALVKKGGKFGLINAQAKELIPPKYDELGDQVVHGLLIAVRETYDNGRKFGLIDTTGKVIIPFDFDCFCPNWVEGGYKRKACFILNTYHGSVSCLTGHNGCLIVRQEKLYGLWHRSGRMIAPCIYEHIEGTADDIFIVQKEGKYGMLSTDGKEIVASVHGGIAGCYDDQSYQRYHLYKNSSMFKTKPKIIGIHDRFGYALAEQYEQYRRYGLVNRNGELVFPCESVNYINFDEEGMAEVAFFVEGKMRYNCIDSTCKIVFPNAYDKITDFYKGYAFGINENKLYRLDRKGESKPLDFTYVHTIEKISKTNEFYKVGVAPDKGGKVMGVLNIHGKTIIKPLYKDIIFFDKENLFIAQSKDGTYCEVFNTKGDWIQKLDYAAISTREKEPGFFSMRLKDWKEGRMRFIDGRFKEVIPCLYQGEGSLLFEHGRSWAYMNGLMGVIDTNGKILLEVKYRRKDGYLYNNKSVFLLEDEHQQYHTYNINTNKLLPLPGLTANHQYHTGFFICKNNGYWGMIDTTGNQRIPFQYDSLSPLPFNLVMKQPLFTSKKDNFWGLVDQNGKIILETKFQTVEWFSSELFKVQKDSLYGLMNLRGDTILPIRHRRLDRQDYGFNTVRGFIILINEEKKYGLIDNTLGKLVLPLEYDLIKVFSDSKQEQVYFRCVSNGKMGLAGKNGKMILPIEYEQIDSANHPNLFLVQLKGKWFYVDKNNICQKNCD